MSAKTNIEWATSTGNPWIGCTKVSPGCAYCYAAEMDATKFSRTLGKGTKEKPESHWGKGAPRVRTKAFWKDAVRWNREAGQAHTEAVLDCVFTELDKPNTARPYQRPRIFPSLCDWLDDEVPIQWLADFLKLIHDTPNLSWLLLTKRPENFKERIAGANLTFYKKEDDAISGMLNLWWLGKESPSNVWIGVSVEDQKRANERIPLLLKIPAKVRFLSVEPLLGPVILPFPSGASTDNLKFPQGFAGWTEARREEWFQTYARATYIARCSIGLDWVIVGGESGPGRRDCGAEAICNVARQCVAANVPIFVKQDCATKPGQQGRIPDEVWKLKQFPCHTVEKG